MTPGKLTDERLPDYALGLLEPAEAAELEVLLARSERARAELRRLQAPLVTLTEALPPLQPPVRAWDALQARLEATPVATATVSVAPVPEAPPAPQRPRPYLGWALAACLALVAAGESVWLQRSQTASRQLGRETLLVSGFLSAPDVRKIPLYGREREGLGSVLARPNGDALFVLAQAPSGRQSYQAWGHTGNDWEPGSGDRLTSLGVSNRPIFEVSAQPFIALYLSLEPAGGSPQPTYPLSRVSLTDPATTTPLSITSPEDGAVLDRKSVIVTGVVAADTTDLSYTFNGKDQTTTLAGNRFSFTLSLEPGVNILIVRATGPRGTTAKTLTLTRP